MKKHMIMTSIFVIMLMIPTSALELPFEAANDGNFGKPTSVEVVQTADGGALNNEDISKNAALIPPRFGSETSNLKGSGAYLTPNLAPESMTGTAVINGTATPVMEPGTMVDFPTFSTSFSTGFTDVTSDLYYNNGSLGSLQIPAIDLNERIYQETDSATLKKGIGHFSETSIWDGNVALAAHNRGANSYFSEIHTLNTGDEIKLTTMLGTRIYKVVSISKVSETDDSSLAATTENCITMVAFSCYFVYGELIKFG
jgi:sortase A